MKKSLTFKTLLTAASFIVMQTTLSAVVYAANPFADVPAGHWAYESINKLAAAGVIEGYGDDTFCGDRLMTRYEMAQIVAKAMAKGANIGKLAAEFSEELEALEKDKTRRAKQREYCKAYRERKRQKKAEGKPDDAA